MKKILGLAVAAGALFAAATPAVAAQHCGRGYHRGYHNRCVPNRRYARPRLVIGTFYHGRGYWDGHRYRQHRYRYHNGWRYR